MNSISLTLTTKEEKGVLDEITDILSEHGVNISYVHLYVKDDVGTLNLELDNVEHLDELIDDLNSQDFILNIEIHGSLNDIFGKRVLIFGGGAQVSQVAVGAITEADRHNIRGERISVDTIPLVGEENIAEAVDAVNRLPRVSVLVLAGSLMGGKITETVRNLK
jgi:energy-converting hydrogenase B subunit Q